MDALPASDELEQSVLASMAASDEALIEGMDLLKGKDFYTPRNAILFNAITHLFNDGESVGMLSINEHVKRTGNDDKVGGTSQITRILTGHTSSNFRNECLVLAEKSMARDAFALSQLLSQSSRDPMADVFETIETTARDLNDIISSRTAATIRTIGDLAPSILEEMTASQKRGGQVIGVDTGFKKLNTLTSGWCAGDLWVIAARPSMGKTTICMNFLQTAAEAGVPAAMFSLEMTERQIGMRLFASEAKVSFSRFRAGTLRDEEVIRIVGAANRMSKLKLFIDDTTRTAHQIAARMRKLHAKYGVRLFCVDYMQLLMMRGRSSSEISREIGEQARLLKHTAKDLDATVLAVSQLTREVEKQSVPRPKLFHLKESSALEDAADGVMFIWRPERYDGIDELDVEGYGTVNPRGLAEIIIAKQRNGPIGSALASFIEEYVKFEEYTNREW